MITEQEIELFNALQNKLADAGLELYKAQRELYLEFDSTVIGGRLDPDTLRLESINTIDLTFVDNEGDFEWVSLKDLLNPEESLKQLRERLQKKKEEREVREALRFETKKLQAQEKIRKLQEEFGL